MLFPFNMVTAGPALAVAVITFTVKVVDLVQVPKVAVTIYGVVVTGFNTGFRIAGLLTPVVGVQLKEVPLLVSTGVTPFPPVQVLRATPWEIVAAGFTVIVKLFVAEHDPMLAVSV